MARSVLQTGNNFRTTSWVPVSDVPFTFAFRWKSDAIAGTRSMVGIFVDGANQYCSFFQVSTTRTSVFWRDTGIDQLSITEDVYADTWYSVVVVAAALDDRRVYFNGNLYTDTTTRTTVAFDGIAFNRGAGAGNGMTGDIAEVAFWNVALSRAEGDSYNLGYSPKLIRLDALVGYWPLLEKSTTDDARAVVGTDITAVNLPPAVPHPPGIIYPDRTVVRVPAAATADEKVMRMLFGGRQVLAPRSRL